MVYQTAGAAVPAVIEATFQSLLNDSFDEAYKKINNVRFVIDYNLLLPLFFMSISTTNFHFHSYIHHYLYFFNTQILYSYSSLYFYFILG